MAGSNEELRARLQRANDALIGASEHHAAIKEAIAALARQEEGREAAIDWRANFIHVSAMRYMDNGLMHDPAYEAAEQDARITESAGRLAIEVPHPAPPSAALAPHSGGEAYPTGSDRDVLLYLMQQFDTESWECPRCGNAEDCATMDSADYLRRYLATPTPQAAGVSEDVIEAAWIAQCGAGWGLSCDDMLRKTFKPGAWGETYQDGETIYTHPEHGTELTAFMAAQIISTHAPFVQGYRAALTAAPASPQGVSDAYRELMEVRAGLCTLGVMGPGETAAEALQRYVTRCTAAGAAPEGWVLVPREPTLAMENAWQQHYGNTFKGRYRAMLAAAPQPGAQHGQEGRE